MRERTEPPQCCCVSAADHPGLEFFKVFLPSFSSHQLDLESCIHVLADTLIHGCRKYPFLQLIPPDFAKQINGKIPNKATLVDHTGRSWSVQLIEVGSKLFIKNGWQEFAADHSLGFGDFLVFCYHHSGSVFHVKIFGKNGCRKEKACAANNPLLTIKIEDEGGVEEQVEERHVGGSLIRPARNCKRKYENLNITKLDNSCSHSADRKRLSNGFVDKDTSKCRLGEQFVLKQPHFVAVNTKWKGMRMDISRSFLQEHQITLKPTVMLRDQNGKLWPSRISQGRIGFHYGWHEFRCRNLHTDDKCLFEFVLDEGNTCGEVIVRVLPKGLAIERHNKYWVVKV